ncbi:pyridoxal 5'-phosphate synthase [Flexivirga sp. ID2601S]|uniref:Pyridoxal 5'-phosphate synthase n=1 Tax=Flexivirga aerilata TaxID=1656889 RepID=A0A849AG76_9MICO|nr:phenazine biosynthesis FMN-dependent oxidase PhzG [Flexivirga aerilata]NNG39409.1 pyridoxal 5'-phosphate synthase [Flexivirga aerilata]
MSDLAEQHRSESMTAARPADFPEYHSPPPDPMPLLHKWIEEAAELGVREPLALALATVDATGQPSSRTVVVGAVTNVGLVIATHSTSRKAHDLRSNERASGLLYWRETSQQLQFEGRMIALDEASSDRLWEKRPVFTHAMTVASEQSATLADPAELRSRAAQLATGAPLPRPARYTAYEFVISAIEFWANGTDRLHERLRYTRTPASAGWSWNRLQP